MKKRTSGNAIASLILGLIFPLAISNILFGVPAFNKTISFALLLCPFVGVLLGHLAKLQIRRANGEIQGLATATAGLALSYAGIALFAITWFFPIDRFHFPPYESSAVGSLRTLNNALGDYARANPTQEFPRTLGELKAKTAGEEPPWTIDSALANGEKVGYKFTYIPEGIGRGEKLGTYVIFADPIAAGSSMLHHFFTDQTGVIRMAQGGSANAQSPPLQ